MQIITKQVTLVWHNPYIADGLVAMWDGEWNAAGGIHDASATTWVDLTGNHRPLAIIPTSGAYWKPQSITTEDTSCKIAYAFSSIGECCPFVSCEIVMRRRGKNWATLVCGGGDGTPGSPGKYAVSFANARNEIAKETGGTAYAFNAPSGSLTQFHIGNGGAWERGVPLTESATPMAAWPVCDTIALGSCYNGYSGSPNYINYHEFFSIRLYRRELSPDEITFNTEIDHIRFGV